MIRNLKIRNKKYSFTLGLKHEQLKQILVWICTAMELNQKSNHQSDDWIFTL